MKKKTSGEDVSICCFVGLNLFEKGASTFGEQASSTSIIRSKLEPHVAFHKVFVIEKLFRTNKPYFHRYELLGRIFFLVSLKL